MFRNKYVARLATAEFTLYGLQANKIGSSVIKI